MPNLEGQLDQLKATLKSIVESISKEISKDHLKIFVFNCDFYNIIKDVEL